MTDILNQRGWPAYQTAFGDVLGFGEMRIITSAAMRPGQLLMINPAGFARPGGLRPGDAALILYDVWETRKLVLALALARRLPEIFARSWAEWEMAWAEHADRWCLPREE